MDKRYTVNYKHVKTIVTVLSIKVGIKIKNIVIKEKWHLEW